MRILLVYGTSEGQTRKVATFLAEALVKNGDSVTLVDVKKMPPDLEPVAFNAVIVAARVHAASYPWSIMRFVRAHRAALTRVPTAFVSVSMVAGGHSDADRKELDRYVTKFTAKTSWRPTIVHHVAGARLYMNHGVIGRWILGMVDRHRFDTGKNHEFTDWSAVSRFAREFRSVAIRDGGAASRDRPGSAGPLSQVVRA